MPRFKNTKPEQSRVVPTVVLPPLENITIALTKSRIAHKFKIKDMIDFLFIQQASRGAYAPLTLIIH